MADAQQGAGHAIDTQARQGAIGIYVNIIVNIAIKRISRKLMYR